ncbi:MAG TPA: tetratricopeptide repeat protein [Armatimonadota bacterium]|nr:tetratricopeptide repeat protein [Armatimonadota bacterium]
MLAYYFLFILLVPAGLFLPVRWIMRLWLEEGAISAKLGLTGLICHCFIFFYLVVNMRPALLAYCGFLLLAIALLPILGSRAEWRMRSKMAEDDIARYKRKLERFPDNAALHGALGNVYMECRRYDEAIEEYQKAIDLDPDRSRSESWRLREAREAKERLDKLLKRSGKNSEERV